MHHLSYSSGNLALCKRGRPEFGYDSATKIFDDEDSIEYLPTQDMPQTHPLNDTAGHEYTTKKKNTSKKKDAHRRKHTESMQPNTTDNLATLDTPQSGSSSASAASAFKQPSAPYESKPLPKSAVSSSTMSGGCAPSIQHDPALLVHLRAIRRSRRPSCES